MAFIQLHIYSEALGMQTTVNMLLPQKNTMGEIGVNGAVNHENYKSLYLLHGLSDDQTIWMRRTSIERYANEYGICVIMPFGGRSFYFDQQNGEKYYTYIPETEEVMSLVKDNEPNIALYADDKGLYFYKNILKE